jgi:sigma-B regulation protein RsbU (phosphoserine phosphatase)
VAIAGPVGVVIENTRLHELAVKQARMEREARDARAVQLALVPKRTPSLPGYRFWHFHEPARYVGGDYYDYRPLPGSPASDRWAVVIGDVTGKGMAAALLITRLSSEVALLLQIEPDPARAVERLNRSLCEAGIDDKPITFLLVAFDGERHELTLVNAGHPAPLLRRTDGSVEELPMADGLMRGVEPGAAYEASRFGMQPGEVVVLYTDGITDAGEGSRDGFGVDRLRQALGGAPPGAEQVGEAIPARAVCLVCFHGTGRCLAVGHPAAQRAGPVRHAGERV